MLKVWCLIFFLHCHLLTCCEALGQETNDGVVSIPIVKSMFPTISISVPGGSPKTCTVSSAGSTYISTAWYEELSRQQQSENSVVINLFNKSILCNKRRSGVFENLPGKGGLGRFAGYLGTDFLEQFDIAYDNDSQTLRLGELDKMNLDDCESIPVKYEIDPESGTAVPKILLAFNDGISCDGEVQLSQTTSLTLTTHVFDSLLEKGLITLGEPASPQGDEVPQELRSGRVRMVKIGKSELSNVICKEGASNQVGAYILQRFLMGLSLDKRVMLLKLQKACAWDHSDSDGISFKIKVTQSKLILSAKSVAEGSLAAQAGILPGDELVQVGDAPGSQYYAAASRLIFRDKPVVVDIFRDKKQFKITLPDSPQGK